MRLERGEKLGQDGVDGQDFRHLGAYPSSTTRRRRQPRPARHA